MSFWRDRMPQDMYLRSGTDWHLDANGEYTFEAFVEEQGPDPADLDPIPISVFLDHADWFAAQKGSQADQRPVASPTARTARSSPPWTTERSSRPTAWSWPWASATSRQVPEGTHWFRRTGAPTP